MCKIYSNDRIVLLREILFSLLVVILGLVSLALVRVFSDPEDFEENVEEVQVTQSHSFAEEGSSVDGWEDEYGEFLAERESEDSGTDPIPRAIENAAFAARQTVTSDPLSHTAFDKVGSYNRSSGQSSIDGAVISAHLGGTIEKETVSGSDEASRSAWGSAQTAEAHVHQSVDKDLGSVSQSE